jgi:hypothetical protein
MFSFGAEEKWQICWCVRRLALPTCLKATTRRRAEMKLQAFDGISNALDPLAVSSPGKELPQPLTDRWVVPRGHAENQTNRRSV